MGTDIRCYAEQKINNRWEMVKKKFPTRQHHEPALLGDELFCWRQYGLFGFLGDVRNYSHCTPILAPRYALPDDVSDGISTAYEDRSLSAHTCSWLLLSELLEFDYKTFFWNRRITIKLADGGEYGAGIATDEEAEGEMVTYEEFLGKGYFEILEILQTLGDPDDVRIVFWFEE